jgi:Fe-S-cluster containining protein
MPLEVRIEDLMIMGLVSSTEMGVETITKKRIQQIVKGLQKLGIIKSYRSGTGLFLMTSKPNGDCQFLDSNRRCSIYSNRPQVCRKFPESIGLRFGYCPYIKK